MTASIIPPPIVESTYASPSRSVMQSAIISKPTPLQDRQSELEADLQFLLDAQSEGLLRGLEGGMVDDQASTGSTTPTAQSVRSASARRAPRAARRKPGLRSSRKGIYNAIRALSTVKDEELQSIDEDISEKERTLEQIDEWEKKKSGLQDASKTVESNEDTVRVQRLRQQADNLQAEINHVELQLSDMKARHRKLVRQATAVENSVQAKMASYTSSLRMLEEDVQRFLSLEPTQDDSRSPSRHGSGSMWELPAERRTLQMAKEDWNGAKESLMQQKEETVFEKEALDEGAVVWKEVVTQVTEFERQLRAEMTNLSTVTGNRDATSDASQGDASQRLREVLDQMRSLTETLESKFELAKERNWNLLIAAIGAELDAIRKGRELLENVLRSAQGQPEELVEPPEDDQLIPNSGEEIQKLDESFETKRRLSNGTESEDDPDPELLFSKHDTDTE